MTSAVRILIVEDEEYLADLVATALGYEGFQTLIAPSAAAARTAVAEFEPDLIVLDIGLPDGSGIDLCRSLRRAGSAVSIIFLTARDSTQDKIAGLDVGGDDYLTKPFSLGELVARIGSVLRRQRPDAARPSSITIADVELDDRARRVRRGGRDIDLTPTEFDLLRLLMTHPGQVLTKQQILDQVWEYDFGGSAGVLHTYVSYLRRKLDGDGPPLIHTVPRVGYVLRVPG